MSTIRHALLIAAVLVFPTTSSADSRQLFNGKDLSGWKHVGSGRFVVEVCAPPRNPVPCCSVASLEPAAPRMFRNPRRFASDTLERRREQVPTTGAVVRNISLTARLGPASQGKCRGRQRHHGQQRAGTSPPEGSRLVRRVVDSAQRRSFGCTQLPPVPDSVLRLVLAVHAARPPCGYDVAPSISIMDRDPELRLASERTPMHARMPHRGLNWFEELKFHFPTN